MEKRIEKWAKKLSGENRKRLYDSQKNTMVRLESKAEEDLVNIEISVKSIIQGCPHLYIPYYIIFGKEIYRLKNKFKGQTLINELEILQDKWTRRGLRYYLLDEIKSFYVPSYRKLTCPVARFDLGRFNVNCFG